MPSTFLTFKERERLTSFPDEIPQWDLITYFTLTEHDGSLIGAYQSDANRLGAALQLCAVRYLGFCPTHLRTASNDVVAFLADQLQVEPGALQDYGKRRMTRSAHFNTVLHHLGFRRLQPNDHKAIVDWLTERALEHDKPTLLLQMISGRRPLTPISSAFCNWAIASGKKAMWERRGASPIYRLKPAPARWWNCRTTAAPKGACSSALPKPLRDGRDPIRTVWPMG